MVCIIDYIWFLKSLVYVRRSKYLNFLESKCDIENQFSTYINTYVLQNKESKFRTQKTKIF